MDNEFDNIINEIEIVFNRRFDKHLESNPVSLSVCEDGDITVCIETLDKGNEYEFSLFNLVKNDKYHSMKEKIDSLRALIKYLQADEK